MGLLVSPAGDPPGAPQDGSLAVPEVATGARATVGGLEVTRLLPKRARRSVGPWCFADLIGPAVVAGGSGLDVGPHPHIGLQTVTWLFEGAVLHRDSLGSEQIVRPGELNLMTAGDGVAHSEETSGVYSGPLHGIQLWIAQPDATRGAAADFAHLDALPRSEVAGGVATVVVGEYARARSPARRDTEHVGVDLSLPGGRATLPLEPRFEHALIVVRGSMSIGGRPLVPGKLAYLAAGRAEVAVDLAEPARIMLIGGEPFPEPLLLWWNYVARTRAEVLEAHRAWSQGDARFAAVDSPLARIEVAGPPWS